MKVEHKVFAYLAVDLGAESGRVMLGKLSLGPVPQVTIQEMHRFANAGHVVQGNLTWDIAYLFQEIKTGILKAAAGIESIASLSVDAWGVDYVLFNKQEPILGLPFHYRDKRTETAMEKVFAKVSADEIFAETGIQFMSINTLFQFYMDLQDQPKALESADGFLNIGDYFNYLLSGNAKAEVSLAATTQIYNPLQGNWAWKLIDKLGYPKKNFPELVSSGTVLGPLLPEFIGEPGLKETKVIATCSHDTAAAVAAIPAKGENWAFLSSGTWSLLGAEVKAPMVTETCRKFNFTNEAGYAGTTMLRKNIIGLWVLQECKREWAEGGKDYTYDQLSALANSAKPLVSVFQPNDPRFSKPGHMVEKIADYCRVTSQPIPEDPGAITRCILESLALIYTKTLLECEMVSGMTFSTLHLVGGGSRNDLLNQLAANAMGIPVIVGPIEATAIGNILIQAKALGQLNGNLREVVKNSFPTRTYNPQEGEIWKRAFHRFKALPF